VLLLLLVIFVDHLWRNRRVS